MNKTRLTNLKNKIPNSMLPTAIHHYVKTEVHTKDNISRVEFWKLFEDF